MFKPFLSYTELLLKKGVINKKSLVAKKKDLRTIISVTGTHF